MRGWQGIGHPYLRLDNDQFTTGWGQMRGRQGISGYEWSKRVSPSIVSDDPTVTQIHPLYGQVWRERRPTPKQWLVWNLLFHFFPYKDTNLSLFVPTTSGRLRLFGHYVFAFMVSLSNSIHMRPFPSPPSLPRPRNASNAAMMVFSSWTILQDSILLH